MVTLPVYSTVPWPYNGGAPYNGGSPYADARQDAVNPFRPCCSYVYCTFKGLLLSVELHRGDGGKRSMNRLERLLVLGYRLWYFLGHYLYGSYTDWCRTVVEDLQQDSYLLLGWSMFPAVGVRPSDRARSGGGSARASGVGVVSLRLGACPRAVTQVFSFVLYLDYQRKFAPAGLGRTPQLRRCQRSLRRPRAAIESGGSDVDGPGRQRDLAQGVHP